MTVEYTPNESALLKILHKQKGEPIETTKIVVLRYPKESERPRYAREAIVCVLNQLMAKVKKKGELFRIKKTARKGPHPSKYWIA